MKNLALRKKDNMTKLSGLPLTVMNQVFFPYVHFVFTKLSEQLIWVLKEAVEHHEGKFVVTTIQKKINENQKTTYYEVGVLCQITKFDQVNNNQYKIDYDSIARFVINSIEENDKEHLVCSGEVKEIPELDPTDAETIRYHHELKKCLLAYSAEKSPSNYKHIEESFKSQEAKDGEVSTKFLFAQAFTLIDAGIPFKQKILATLDTKELYKSFLSYFKPELDQLAMDQKKKKLKQDISTKTQKNLEKSQKEYMLKEQMKTIRKELGDDEEDDSVYLGLMKKYEKLKLPKDAQDKISRELKRFQKMNSATAEYQSIENYLHTFLNYPWNNFSEKKFILEETRKILASEHFGIEHVKRRIIEYLSALQFTKDIPPQILCFFGPPGVGKTSICKSIAHALGREYVRISLGGVSDEAEIRGHRRTYVGALPGKIVQALNQAKTANPVIVLDEIDKVGRNNIKGSVESALLEVLDPEQNKNFQDHYLATGIDLSKVIFIATANDISQISAPLRDRMEMIELYSYTLQEKIKIAQNFIIGQEQASHGLNSYAIKILDTALKDIILNYTQEAGVRNLRKRIASIFRQSAVKILEGSKEIIVDDTNLKDFLGDDIIIHEKAKVNMKPGIATGLAWTPHGGEILFVEASKMPGSGQLKITGQLGGVMKESAEIALSYVRSQEMNNQVKFSDKTLDLHIHVPAGATPKDGPSAGVTLVTTIVSLLSNRKVRATVAMTGEISLQGEVLAVGGIKEKVIAAYMSGITEVIIPEQNKSDINKLPDEIKNNSAFKIHPVNSIEQVLEIALEKEITD